MKFKEKFKLFSETRKNEYDFFEQSVSTSKSGKILACNVYGSTKEDVLIRARIIESAPEMFELLNYILYNDDGVGIALGYNSREMIKQLLTKIT